MPASQITVVPSTATTDGITIDTNANGELQIKNGGVGSELITNNAITEEKINSGAVTINKLGTNVYSWELLTSSTLSGSSTTINPSDMATFDELLIIIKATTTSGTTTLYFEPNVGVTVSALTENGNNSTSTSSRFKLADVGSSDITTIQKLYTNNGESSAGTWFGGFYQETYTGSWNRRSGTNMSSFNIETGAGGLDSLRSQIFVYGRKH